MIEVTFDGRIFSANANADQVRQAFGDYTRVEPKVVVEVNCTKPYFSDGKSPVPSLACELAGKVCQYLSARFFNDSIDIIYGGDTVITSSVNDEKKGQGVVHLHFVASIQYSVLA